MLRKAPSITYPRSSPPDFSPRRREDLRSPAVLVVSRDSLLRWALYEALMAAQFRVLTCSDDAHAREILPKVDVEFVLAIIDDDTWPMTPSERDWLHLRWPDLPIVVLVNPEQSLEHRIDELGLADVLLKPFDVTDLVQLAERIVYAPVRARHLSEPALGAA